MICMNDMQIVPSKREMDFRPKACRAFESLYLKGSIFKTYTIKCAHVKSGLAPEILHTVHVSMFVCGMILHD